MNAAPAHWRRWPVLPISAIIALAIVLRFYHIAERSLWFDEAVTGIVTKHGIDELLKARIDPMAPPLYNILLKVWYSGLSIFQIQQDEFALRSFSAASSVGALVLVYLIGAKMFNRTVGIWAAFIMAIMPFQVYYAQEARWYALGILCGAAMLWGFVRAIDTDRFQDWLLFTLTVIIGIYVNYYLGLTLVAFHLFIAGRSRLQWRAITKLVLVDILIIIALLPLLPDLLTQTGLLAEVHSLTAPSGLSPLVTLVYLMFGRIIDAPWFFMVSLLVLLLLMAFAIHAMLPSLAHGDFEWPVLLAFCVFVPTFLMIGVSYLIRPLYYDRWFAFTTPALIVLIAQMIDKRPRIFLRGLIVVLLVLGAIKLANDIGRPDITKPPFRFAAYYIKDHWQPNDVILSLHDSTYLPLRYYLPEATSFLWKDDAASWLVPSAWAWFGDRIDVIQPLMAKSSRIWLVYPQVPIDPSRQAVIDAMKSQFSRQDVVWFDSLELELYVRRN